jgi:uncharacterized protein (DUF305 family)
MMESHTTTHAASQTHYGRLLLMIVLSFISMYVLMYGMVNTFANVYMNVTQIYMAGVMAASSMAVFWVLLRQQAAVSDRQFLRSMIPHHAGAILMCERAPLQDAEIQALCRTIVSGQRAEIDQMKAKLRALAR